MMRNYMNLSRKNKYELGMAFFFILPALYAIFEINTKFTAAGFNSGGGRDNAGMFPELISYIILFLAIIRVISIFIETRSHGKSDDEEFVLFRRSGLKRTVGMFTTFVLYLLILPYLGYLAATALGLIASLAVLGVRKPIINIPIALGIDLAIWFVFSQLLNVVLPAGRFGLYL